MSLMIKPIITEKSVRLAKEGTYMFDVDKSSDKLSVSAAVADRYDVEVDGVNIQVRDGKSKMSYRKGRRPQAGRTKDRKIAFVSLVDGASISDFDEAIEGMEE